MTHPLPPLPITKSSAFKIYWIWCCSNSTVSPAPQPPGPSSSPLAIQGPPICPSPAHSAFSLIYSAQQIGWAYKIKNMATPFPAWSLAVALPVPMAVPWWLCWWPPLSPSPSHSLTSRQTGLFLLPQVGQTPPASGPAQAPLCPKRPRFPL